MAGRVIKICSCVALRALCQLVVASNCCCLSDYYCCNNASIIEVALKRIGALHNSIVYNSLETRYLCLLKWSGKMLQNLKSLLGFSCSKTMVEAFFPGYFIKHKPHISEEWYSIVCSRYFKFGIRKSEEVGILSTYLGSM